MGKEPERSVPGGQRAAVGRLPRPTLESLTVDQTLTSRSNQPRQPGASALVPGERVLC